jgi:hypothetical protein
MDIPMLEAKLTAWEFQRSFEQKMEVISEVQPQATTTTTTTTIRN